MDIDEYLWRNKITRKNFAERVGMAAQTMSLLASKKITPSLPNAVNIVKASGGMITYHEMIKEADREKLVE